MSNPANYRAVLDAKLKAALAHLTAGDFEALENQQLEQPVLDAAVQDETRPAELADVMSSFLGDVDPADMASLMAKECQLQLVRLFTALEQRDYQRSIQVMADVLLYCCLFLEEGHVNFSAVAKGAHCVMEGDEFQQARILLIGARHCSAHNWLSAASDLLDRIEPEATGPLRPLYDDMRRRLSAS